MIGRGGSGGKSSSYVFWGAYFRALGLGGIEGDRSGSASAGNMASVKQHLETELKGHNRSLQMALRSLTEL